MKHSLPHHSQPIIRCDDGHDQIILCRLWYNRCYICSSKDQHGRQQGSIHYVPFTSTAHFAYVTLPCDHSNGITCDHLLIDRSRHCLLSPIASAVSQWLAVLHYFTYTLYSNHDRRLRSFSLVHPTTISNTARQHSFDPSVSTQYRRPVRNAPPHIVRIHSQYL